MLNVKLERSYRSKNGNVTFVYSVTGSDENLEKYRGIQGDYHRQDDATGKDLWFTTRCIGKSGSLIITQNNNIVPDMSEYDQAASLAAQYGGNFGDALAKATASRILGTTEATEEDE